PSPLYLYLLDFGLSGAVSLMYPAIGGEQKPIPRDHDLWVGRDAGDEIALRMPPGFPYGGRPEALREGWLASVKLFATTEETDFGPLVQRPVRGADAPLAAAGAAETPLARLLRASATGWGTRDVERLRPAATGDWTVVQRCFRVLP